MVIYKLQLGLFQIMSTTGGRVGICGICSADCNLTLKKELFIEMIFLAARLIFVKLNQSATLF